MPAEPQSHSPARPPARASFLAIDSAVQNSLNGLDDVLDLLIVISTLTEDGETGGLSTLIRVTSDLAAEARRLALEAKDIAYQEVRHG